MFAVLHYHLSSEIAEFVTEDWTTCQRNSHYYLFVSHFSSGYFLHKAYVSLIPV